MAQFSCYENSYRSNRAWRRAALALCRRYSGTWESEFDSQIGNQKYTFTFRQDGTNLTGEAHSEIGDQKRQVELKEGKVQGDTVSFVEMLNFQDNEIRITYTGTILTNDIKFIRQVGDFATENIVATREASEETAPAATNYPARVPGRFAIGRPAPLPVGVTAERNIPYVKNASPSQVLDLFLPEPPSTKPLPLMIWIHGGALDGRRSGESACALSGKQGLCRGQHSISLFAGSHLAGAGL